MTTLTDRLRAAIAAPATDDSFHPATELADVLGGIGMSAEDTGGTVTFDGADPVVPSTLRLGGASAIALAAKSAAVAKLWQVRGGVGQDIAVDLRSAPHRLCPFYDRRWEMLNGYPPATPSNPSNALGFRFYRTGDDRWMMPLNPYPKIKVGAQRLLGVPDDNDAVAAAIASWKGAELEAAATEAGVVLPMLRTTAELLDETHYRDVLADMPLIEITRIADGDPVPLTGGVDQPLDGIRALGMGHVIAGAGVGRALALHGADVLNVWRPDELEHDATYATANVGVRSSTINPYDADGAARIRGLLGDADVFYANRRPGYLDKIGLSADAAADGHRGIIYATASLNGEHGPWSSQVGFDQTAGSLTGMMLLEGGGDKPKLPPILVVNDYIVSWLLTAGIVEALTRRARDGGSYRVHVSLTRAALWIIGMGVFDRGYAHEIAGTDVGDGAHHYLDPETFTADTPLGAYQGVTDQVRMSQTPGRYRTVLVPRGSCRPEWLARPD
ncbi:putative CoA transferase family protein [Gordonia polyisoprenivorans VH2]|uniref:Putative CoA transferase family protein n=1 Tax=Gordonia polyisoprenivorans (strain DSM 44266 / VH2) TaxID=1112204 RepID=H6N3K8_GORPV|nr:CoA transferase [Gordonia polyisoprenivorans]AFA73479.1 putative CoA transferase family protein [Gordonia polyisoprenivorans VH2]